MTAKEFAQSYYQLDKSRISSLSVKSAIRFAERYAELMVTQEEYKTVVNKMREMQELLKEANHWLDLVDNLDAGNVQRKISEYIESTEKIICGLKTIS